ncbi:DUF3168 domain-containing protein [Cloacibacillus evryensis]|uniref:DUF3168 domain-containing protein n=1 Tax=Cloacibacillus evryensis TaxID=508460 RepID=UPI0004B4C138|nr:DUF3168 domain-containing protein [Cloacibacillus evryensis]
MSMLTKHTELYAALKNNAALAAVITGIYDMPPDNAASPYIQVGDTQEVSDDLLNNTGAEITTTLHIWSRYAGRKEILQIGALIKKALPAWALDDGMEIMRDSAEPDWWHGVIDIRYYEYR